MKKIARYFNRDLSWLSFNYKVLEQIKDKSLPLFERIKFLAIYSSNLDEFYRVRVAYQRSLIDIAPKNRKNLDYNPEEILEKIKTEVDKQQKEYDALFHNEIIPGLEDIGLILYQNQELNDEHKNFLEEYFLGEVLPYIQPVLLTQGDVLTFLQDNVIYLAVKMHKRSKKGPNGKRKRPAYALIKIL